MGNHELKIERISEQQALPYCACGWIGTPFSAFAVHQQQLASDEYRRHGSPVLVPADEWVTLKEASAAAGVAVSTLRKWYGSDKIPSRLEPGPSGDRRMVPLVAVLERAGVRDRPRPTERMNRE